MSIVKVKEYVFPKSPFTIAVESIDSKEGITVTSLIIWHLTQSHFVITLSSDCDLTSHVHCIPS